jgi:transcriptional regulator with PAS, ATPase and Fis domain
LYISFESDAYKEWKRIYNKITAIENSDDENEYMKSILPKQKSYIVRFALLLNVLDNYSNSLNYDKISKKSILNAERLSDYFIMMARKNKIEANENKELKDSIKASGKRSAKEKFEFLFAENPELNRSKIAEELNVSRMTINRWLKELKQM